jgi:imidazolonepropionase-like amidohydrolase
MAMLGLAGAAQAASRLALMDVTVIDGTGSQPEPHRTVLIEGERIVAVTPSGQAPPRGFRRINLAGKFVIPGLWDMHVHTLWSDEVPRVFLPRFVAYGVTTVRDMGGNEAGWAAARRVIAERPAWTPRIYRAGPILDGPEPVDPRVSIAVADAASGRAAVDLLAGQGVDFIKVYTLLPPEAFRAVAERSRELGLRVAGHIPFGATLDDVIAARMASIEHVNAELGGYCAKDDHPACPQAFQRLIAAGVVQTPTLLVRERRAYAGDNPGWVQDPEFRAMPAGVRAEWSSSLAAYLGASADRRQSRKSDFEHERWMTSQLIAAGAAVLVGTDTGTAFAYPGRSIHEELGLLVDAGLSPLQAIAAATGASARFMGDERGGRIDAGFAADLVVLDADPSIDIRNTRRIRAVVRAGTWHSRGRLDRALATGPGD